MNEQPIDLLVIGGGINGVGIAADAAGRGLSVILAEQDDLAFATSSSSSKLIHGGLRYLENYEFKLVREALAEREVLLQKAPFLIHPLEFVLPYEKHLRPKWLLRCGLFLYDHLARRSIIPGSRKIKFKTTIKGQPLKPDFEIGFTYYDCRTDDARLVVLNALAAQEYGAQIFTRTICQRAERQDGIWQIELFNKLSQEKLQLSATAIVNATGPWVTDTLTNVIKSTSPYQLQLVKGSHIVVQQLYPEEHAYILQNPDNRVVFVIPFAEKFSLIGTTDVPYHGNPNDAAISADEVGYLLHVINRYFKKSIAEKDIVWRFSGVRPLFDDHSPNPTKTTREYHLDLDDNGAPILSVFGGKLTTYRTLAEHALEKLRPYFPGMGANWTATEKLPGGYLDGKSLNVFVHDAQQQYSWLSPETLLRYVYSYGDNIHALLQDAVCVNDLGCNFGADLTEREVLYLIENEWAQTADDILWRRSKLGLRFSPLEKEKLEQYTRCGYSYHKDSSDSIDRK